MGESRGSRCTRSRAAPDWTAEESLILVNEIYAVESEWGTTLPSFQKWKQIVENCNALEVSRNLNQCKRKWDELLAEYRRVKHESAARARATATADVSFPVDLFNAIDMCVGAKGRKCGGGAAALAVTEDEEAEAEEEEQVAMATDPDSDPEAQGRATEFFLETGTKKQRPRMKRQKRKLETLNPWGYSTSANIKHEEECSNVNEKQNITAITHEHEERSAETKEQIMATMLWENALQINAILEGNIADETDYKLADLKNAEAVEIDFTRLQALSDDTAFAKSLIKFKQSLVNPIKLDNWIEPVDKLCSWNTPIWKGCLCANGSFMGLKLENMGLSGVIDVESLAELPLLSLSLMNNNFSGPFPSGINKLVKLRSLFLANNRFSGEISDDAFVGMKGMRKVVMGNNGFSGRIPMSLLGLPKLVDLEIQNNRFVGRIPDFWQEDLSVDFSNNDLEGVIPATLVNRNATSFLGNKNLCGKPLEPCKQNKPIKKIAFVLSAVIGFSLVIAFTALILLRRNRSKPLKYQKSIDNFQIEAPYYSNNNENKNSKKRATTNNYKTSTNFENGKLYFVRNDRERFELDELLRASAEVLGSGSFGSSYKALLRSGYPYVVRRFRQMNNAGKEDFCQHLTKLGKLKHVNLLPVVAFYYRKEEKLLITDFVENGSLASHLHGMFKFLFFSLFDLSLLDLIMVPSGLMICMGYHVWLWNRVRTQPFTTVIGTNSHGRRFWVSSIIKDNEKKNILAVQTFRNTIMGSTLMATTSILLCSALAAVISSTYSIKKPLNDAVYGAHGQFMLALKYVTLLVLFLFSFVCHTLSIRFINQVNFLINCPPPETSIGGGGVTAVYVAELLERGFALNTAGNRLFYSAVSVLLWIFGPMLVFICSSAMVSVLYNLDLVFVPEKLGKLGGDIRENGSCAHCIAV